MILGCDKVRQMFLSLLVWHIKFQAQGCVFNTGFFLLAILGYFVVGGRSKFCFTVNDWSKDNVRAANIGTVK